MAQCEHCGKTPQVGNNVSFSKRRTKRRFNPNIQRLKTLENGRLVKKVLCSRCLKALHKV